MDSNQTSLDQPTARNIRSYEVIHGDPPHPLDAIRIERGIRRRDICRVVGISTSAYYRHVSGRVLLDDTTVNRIMETILNWDPQDSLFEPAPLRLGYRRKKSHTSRRDFLYPMPKGTDPSPRIGMGGMPPVSEKKPNAYQPFDEAEIYARWRAGESKTSLYRTYAISDVRLNKIIAQQGKRNDQSESA